MSLLLSRTLIVAALAVFLAPVLWLLTTAYKPARDIFGFPPGLAFSPTLDNFRAIAGLFDLPQLLGTSLLVSGGATVVALLMGVPAGYALARSSSRWAMGVAYLFLAVRMVPPVATLIPFYVLMRDMGLLGTPAAVILMHGMLSTTLVTWLMFGQFRALPRVLEEAAVTDGCSRLGAFLRIALPLAAPGIVAAALLAFMLSWNDFLFASFLTSARSRTLSVALLSAYGTRDVTWGTMGALAHVAVLPIVVLALVLNRFFTAGMTRGVH
ncbi:MAG TPA: carbohydrate ABC transporter permease [Geminicoccaceae bacterium]|nr:carbohydrate ABC transporter permease [Geminicoccus sp.]HMU52102.1 carbohydrate ABC transporter permease [Geminicoccaceae bacterium]